MNGIGLLLAALNVWKYGRQYNGAVALGNLWVAILVRNEFFGRILYLFVNTCFAKVSVTLSVYLTHAHYGEMPVDSSVVQARMHICLATSRRHSQWLRTLWRVLARPEGRQQFPSSCCEP